MVDFQHLYGIYLSTFDYNVITNNRVEGHGLGVHLSDSECDKNLVTANVLVGNSSGGLSDHGTDTVTSGNIT